MDWVNKLRVSAAIVLVLLTLAIAPSTSSAWDVLDRFGGDSLYLAYEMVYRVNVSTPGAGGAALSAYTLHIVIEKLNRTHYLVSALAGDVTYSFTSRDVVFLHVLAPLYIANLSKYFIDLLYVPPSEGVTINVVLPKDSVPLFLNSVARWYKIVEDTSGETCQEIRVGSITVSSGVRYRMLTPRAELVYDCRTGILVSLTATIQGGVAGAEANIAVSIELSKLNFLNLTSIKLYEEGEALREPLPTLSIVLLASTTAILAVVIALTLVIMRKLKQLKATMS